MKKLITHNGSFHADDVFACATLCLYLEKHNQKFKIIRTRDEVIIKTGDYVFDVGGVSNAKKNHFDHHQKGGAGKHKSGIEYAACGLVWKKFGEKLTGSKEAASLLENRLIAPIDADDNGIDLVRHRHQIVPYSIQDFIYAMRPSWRETDKTKDEMFLRTLEVAKVILEREISKIKDFVVAEKMILRIYNRTKDKRMIVLDQHCFYKDLSKKFPKLLFVVYPRKDDNTWGVEALRKNLGSFKSRKNFPKTWAGLRNKDLQKVSGVKDAIFCHRALFMAVAKSKEGAVKLAQIALES